MDHLGVTYLTACGLQAEKIQDSTRKAFTKWEKSQPEGVYGTGGACLPGDTNLSNQSKSLEKFPLLNPILGMVAALSICFTSSGGKPKSLC